MTDKCENHRNELGNRHATPYLKFYVYVTFTAVNLGNLKKSFSVI